MQCAIDIAMWNSSSFICESVLLLGSVSSVSPDWLGMCEAVSVIDSIDFFSVFVSRVYLEQV